MSHDKHRITSFAELEKKQQHKRPEVEDQESPISEWMDNFEIWFIANWKQIVKGFCVVAVFASIGIIIASMYRSHQAKITAEFANAATPDAIEALLKAHPSHKSADAVRFKLSALYVKDSKFELARKPLLDIVSAGKSDMFVRGTAALNAAYLLEKSGKAQDAANEFSSIYKNMDLAEDIRVEAAYSAMRIFLDLDQTASASQAASAINMSRADAIGATVYGYWAAKAKRLSAKLAVPATAAAATGI